MCIAVPARIENIEGDKATVNYGGVTMKTNITFIEKPEVGDYVLIHAGCAIEKINEEEALETLKLFDEMAEVLKNG